jgi:hypothetical protein
MSETNADTAPAFEGWAILEIMGHRTRPGFVREVEIAGGKMLRVDIPTVDGDITEFYTAQSIYALRPCSEEIARNAAQDRWGAMRKPVRPVDYREEGPASIGHDTDDDDFDGMGEF